MKGDYQKNICTKQTFQYSGKIIYFFIFIFMTTPFMEDEEEDELLLDDADLTGEITLDDVEELEEEANTGHRVQTYDPADDGTDNYFDEQYFDE